MAGKHIRVQDVAVDDWVTFRTRPGGLLATTRFIRNFLVKELFRLHAVKPRDLYFILQHSPTFLYATYINKWLKSCNIYCFNYQNIGLHTHNMELVDAIIKSAYQGGCCVTHQ